MLLRIKKEEYHLNYTLMFSYRSNSKRAKRLLFAFLAIVLALSCRVKNNNDRTAIVLIYEEPINGYYVSGSFYPFGPTTETGQVELRFVPINGGESFVFSNVDCFEKENPALPSKFTGKNICDYALTESFTGYNNGDTLKCQYFNGTHPGFDSPLYYDAEFQLYDVDFDGTDELLINDYNRGKGGNNYTVYEITPDGIVPKEDYPFSNITSETKFIPESKQIVVRISEDKFDTVNICD